MVDDVPPRLNIGVAEFSNWVLLGLCLLNVMFVWYKMKLERAEVVKQSV